MKVTCLPKNEQKNILTISIDDEPWRDIHLFIFGKKPPLPQHVSSLAEFELQFYSIEKQLAQKYVLRRLSAKSYLSMELKKSLQQKLISPQTIDGVLKDCIRLGFLDDQEEIKRIVSSQLARGKGPQVIQIKLCQKGIPSELSNDLMEKMNVQDLQKEQISKLLKSKYKSRDLTNYKEKQKVICSLMRKGFHYSEIVSILKHDEWDF